MDIKIIAIDSETLTQFSLGQVVSKLQIETSLYDQPGKCTFEMVDTLNKYFYEGSNIQITIDDISIFNGFVFTRTRDHEKTLTVTAYDRIRYLQNKDSVIYKGKTLEYIFRDICAKQSLTCEVLLENNHPTSPVVHDNKSYYEMIKRAIDETLVATKMYTLIRDYNGVLQLLDITNLLTDFVYGDAAFMSGYKFSSSIDRQTYNYIKIIQENSKTQKRDLYVALDSLNIEKWGKLQFFEKVDKKYTAAQIQKRADELLKLYNRKTKTLTFSAIGNPRLSAGSGIILAISDLKNEDVPYFERAFITRCSHTFENSIHTMDLEVEVV